MQQNKVEQKTNHIEKSTKVNKKSMSAIKVRKSIRIVAYNINRLKGNRHKLEILIDKLNEEEYDMIEIIEIKIS